MRVGYNVGMSDTSDKRHDGRPASDPVPWNQRVGMAVLMTLIFAGLEFMVYQSLAPLERGEPPAAAVWGTNCDRVRTLRFQCGNVRHSRNVGFHDVHHRLANVGTH